MQIDLFADYFQFYLQDDEISVGDVSDAWTEDAVQRLRIAVVPHAIAVGTARNDTVPVEIEVLASEPSADFGSWEHVVEADLSITTGRVVVAGCTTTSRMRREFR